MKKDKEKLLEWLYKPSGRQYAALIQTARPFKKDQAFLYDFPRNTLSISPMVPAQKRFLLYRSKPPAAPRWPIEHDISFPQLLKDTIVDVFSQWLEEHSTQVISSIVKNSHANLPPE